MNSSRDVAAHCDAFEFLEFAKEILDQVPPFIHFLIDFEGLGTARMLRDDNLGATFVSDGMNLALFEPKMGTAKSVTQYDIVRVTADIRPSEKPA